jgi:hypothetical protein
MNRDTRLRQIKRFLRGKDRNDVDAFGIYQWIDRCYYEGWWNLAVALGTVILPNALNESYFKRLEFLLAECRRQKDSVYEEPTSIRISTTGYHSQADKTNTQKRLSDGQQARNSFLETIKIRIEQHHPTYRINLHRSGVLRVPSGRTGLVIEMWIDRDNRLFFGVVFRSLRAKKILMEVLEENDEDIRARLGYTFGIHETRTNPDHGWIFTEIIYDNSKPLQDHFDFFVSTYAGFMIIFRAWINRVSFYYSK